MTGTSRFGSNLLPLCLYLVLFCTVAEGQNPGRPNSAAPESLDSAASKGADPASVYTLVQGSVADAGGSGFACVDCYGFTVCGSRINCPSTQVEIMTGRSVRSLPDQTNQHIFSVQIFDADRQVAMVRVPNRGMLSFTDKSLDIKYGIVMHAFDPAAKSINLGHFEIANLAGEEAIGEFRTTSIKKGEKARIDLGQETSLTLLVFEVEPALEGAESFGGQCCLTYGVERVCGCSVSLGVETCCTGSCC